MNNKKATKRALLTSVMALAMCVVMLIGTTFAWFTDTATANVNKIQSGTLDIELYYGDAAKAEDVSTWTKLESGSPELKFIKASAAATEAILWEPGCTYSLPALKVVNNGNLALKYKIQITGINGSAELNNVIDWTIENDSADYAIGTEYKLAAKTAAATDSDILTIKGHMQETAGNYYQNKSIEGISITVLATQDTVEFDSSTKDYDKDAPYVTVNVANEQELRTALYNAPTDGSGVKIVLQNDITLEMLYAAENFGTVTIKDNESGDTLNRYKKGVHPTAEDPNHWNPLVTSQTPEQKAAYGAYFHTGANDERIARLVVKAGQDVIIDLNGHTIAKNTRATHGDWGNVCTDIIGNYGMLTVMNSATDMGTVKGIGYIACGGAVLHNYNGANLVVGSNVTIDGNAQGMAAKSGQYVISNEGGACVIDGATVSDVEADTTNPNTASLLHNASGKMIIKGNAVLNHPASKVVNCKGGEVIVESATITSDVYAIYAKGGTVTVTDSAVSVTGGGTMVEAGGTIKHQ